MFHGRSCARPKGGADSAHPAFEAAHAWQRLCDNARAMLPSAAADPTGEDAGRTWSVFVDSTARNPRDNPEGVSRIWRRYFREAARVAAVQVPPDPFSAA